MRKLAIAVTVLLLLAVAGLMLASVGIIPVPFAQRRLGESRAQMPFTPYTLRQTSEHTAEIRPKLYVNTPCGSIEVKGAEVESIQITMLVETSTGSVQRSQELLDKVSLDINTTGGETRLVVRMPKLESNENARADLAILVPSATNLELRTSLGKVQISGIEGDLEAKTSLGDIIVEGFTGTATLQTSLGNVQVSDSRFTDRLKAVSDLGDVSLSASLARSNILEARLGDLRLHVLPEESYVLEGKVELGGIYVGVPFEGQQSDKSIKGTIGQGDQRGSISASVSLGALRISK